MKSITVGPFPDALLIDLDQPYPHQRLVVQPLDRPGATRRDEILLTLTQRATGGPISFAANLSGVVALTRWLSADERLEHVASPTITIDNPGPYRDLLTLYRADQAGSIMLSLEHWTAEHLRKNRAACLSPYQADELRLWLRAFWTDGLPDVPLRRADEAAEQFAERRVAQRLAAEPARRTE